MIAVYCKHCAREIPSNPSYFGRGTAYCPACEQVTPLGPDAMRRPAARSTLIPDPPAGCSLHADSDSGFRLVVSTRLFAKALGILICALLWNAFSSAYISAYVHAHCEAVGVDPPSWLPKVDIKVRQSNLDRPVLLQVPIIASVAVVGIGMFVYAAFLVWGRVEVRVLGDKGTIFTGIGRVGWKQRFDAANVRSVKAREDIVETDEGFEVRRCIRLDDGHARKFATLLPLDRREWAARTMRELLVR